jgi:SAM-dependent methyltransferase
MITKTLAQEKNKPCILCNNKKHDTILSFNQPDQYEQAVGVENSCYFREWVRCSNCGLNRSIFSRDDDILDTIYTEAYRDKNAAWRNGSTQNVFKRVINLPFDESETKNRIHYIKSNLKKLWDDGICNKRPLPLNLLDIGGGSAVFAYEFRDEVWEVSVVDACASGELLEELKIPFIQDYYMPNLFENSFDLISMVFVLEHIKNPHVILKDIYDDLDYNSFLYIEVPDSNSFELNDEKHDVFNSCHLYIYSPKTLTLLLDECGFEVQTLNRVQTIKGYFSTMLLATKKKA